MANQAVAVHLLTQDRAVIGHLQTQEKFPVVTAETQKVSDCHIL